MSAPALPATERTGSPYKGLDHYQEQDAPFFFGRDVERDLVVANLLAAPLTLLYGQSGVGKSSLLHAGVVPRLREEPDLTVVLFRSWGSDPVAGLSAAIRAAAGLEPSADEPALADTIAACTLRSGRDLVVILDQFEEYFVYHRQEDGDGTFAAEFPRALNRRDLSVSFLVSIREDALARLDRFKGRIPNLFGNYLRMDRLDRSAGKDAIVRPLKEYGRHLTNGGQIEIEPQLVEAILEQVRVGNVQLGQTGAGVIDGAKPREWRIEAPYLQLVLTRLWDEENAAGSHVLRVETLERLGGAERIVPAHLETAMAELSPAERDLSARIFLFLVTPSGTKIAHHAFDLADYAQVTADEIQPLLDRLSGQQARILRGTGDNRYEIYHDVLAAAILDWRARHLQARTARLLWRIAFAFFLAIFIGGVVGYQFTSPRTTSQVSAGWTIGLSVTAMIILLGFWLWGVASRSTPRRRRGIFIFLFLICLLSFPIGWVIFVGFWLAFHRARRSTRGSSRGRRPA
jgi:Novel STAND NTPase 1